MERVLLGAIQAIAAPPLNKLESAGPCPAGVRRLQPGSTSHWYERRDGVGTPAFAVKSAHALTQGPVCFLERCVWLSMHRMHSGLAIQLVSQLSLDPDPLPGRIATGNGIGAKERQ